MGQYRDEKLLVKFMNDHNNFMYLNNTAELVAARSSLTELRARHALELAIHDKLINPPKEPGENYEVSKHGVLYLKKRFAVADQFISSYSSANNFLAIIALITSILGTAISIYISVKKSK